MNIIAPLAGLVLAPIAPALAAPPERQPAAAAPVEFRYAATTVFPVVAAPGRITAILLEPGETLSQTNPIAAGDTARWIIGDAASGEGASRQAQILIKPTQAGLATNLVINTSRRTYFLEARASDRGYLPSVRWRYGDTAPLVAAAPAAAISPPPPISPAKAASLNVAYRVTGPKALRPLRVFDDGARTTIAFGPRQPPIPLLPLYRIEPDGKTRALLNYRVDGASLIVDGLLDQGELRFGAKKAGRVRIVREPEPVQ